VQARAEKELREAVLTAERLLLLETGFRVPAYHLHGDVAALCASASWPKERHQAAWNIVNDRREAPAQGYCRDASA
jgi:hypothetical protein